MTQAMIFNNVMISSLEAGPGWLPLRHLLKAFQSIFGSMLHLDISLRGHGLLAPRVVFRDCRTLEETIQESGLWEEEDGSVAMKLASCTMKPTCCFGIESLRALNVAMTMYVCMYIYNIYLVYVDTKQWTARRCLQQADLCNYNTLYMVYII